MDTDTVSAQLGLREATAVPSELAIEGELSRGLSILRNSLSSPQTAEAQMEMNPTYNFDGSFEFVNEASLPK